MNVIVDYEIKSQTDTTVSFVVNLFQGSFNAYNSQYFYNLDLENDKDITLADLLGEDWVNICNDAVQSYIDASVDEDGFTYFFSADQGGFTTVMRPPPSIFGRTACPWWCSPSTPSPRRRRHHRGPRGDPGLKISDRFREGGFCRPLLHAKA